MWLLTCVVRYHCQQRVIRPLTCLVLVKVHEAVLFGDCAYLYDFFSEILEVLGPALLTRDQVLFQLFVFDRVVPQQVVVPQHVRLHVGDNAYSLECLIQGILTCMPNAP